MYQLVNVVFPFADDIDKGKPRPGFVITSPFGNHNQVVVVYVTTRIDEVLETDIVLDPKENYFSQTGLIKKSVVKLHRLGTFQPVALKEGEGYLPEKLIPELKKKLMKVFQLQKK